MSFRTLKLRRDALDIHLKDGTDMEVGENLLTDQCHRLLVHSTHFQSDGKLSLLEFSFVRSNELHILLAGYIFFSVGCIEEHRTNLNVCLGFDIVGAILNERENMHCLAGVLCALHQDFQLVLEHKNVLLVMY